MISVDDLKSLVTELFARSGVAPDHARTISDVLIWASLRGVDSHGLARVPRYLELLESGEANAKPDLRLSSGAAAVTVLDADRAPGPVALTAAALEAVRLAHSAGIGAVAVRRTVHTGAIGYYTSKIAAEGLIGIAFVAGMGERSAATAATRAAEGIPVGAKVWKEIAAAADRLGVPLPEYAP